MQRKNFSETEDGNVNDIGLIHWRCMALYAAEARPVTLTDIRRLAFSTFDFEINGKDIWLEKITVRRK